MTDDNVSKLILDEIDDVKKELDKIKGISPYNMGQADSDSGDIDKRRSDEMYNSFVSLESINIGVWKVGDKHITDIIDSHGEKNNILTRDQFNEEYNIWDSQNRGPRRILRGKRRLNTP